MPQENKKIKKIVLKLGYKQTPIGKIPVDWRMIKLKNLISEMYLGGNYPNSESDNGLPLIKMGNIERGKINLNKLEFIPQKIEFSEKHLLKNGDFLFNTRNTLDLVGKVAIWRNELPKALFNSNLLKIVFKKKYIYSTEFTNLIFNSYVGLKQLKSFAIGTTSVAAIYDRDLKTLKIPLPSLPEQKKIAEILSTWDNAIETVSKLIDAKKKLKKGLMQQLLTGKTRFKEFGKPAKNGELPEGWEHLKADEIFQNRSVKKHGDLPVLSVTQDIGVVLRKSLERKINMSESNTDTYKLVEVGAFIISLRSFQGGLEYSNIRGLVSPAYHVIYPKININDVFYKFYFKSYYFIGHLAVAVIGIRDGKQISFSDFSFLKLHYPPNKEQICIASILTTADKEIEILNKKLEAIKQQKKGLMQQLLTGRKRVKI